MFARNVDITMTMGSITTTTTSVMGSITITIMSAMGTTMNMTIITMTANAVADIIMTMITITDTIMLMMYLPGWEWKVLTNTARRN